MSGSHLQYVFPDIKLLFLKQNYNVLSPSYYTHISVRDLQNIFTGSVCLFCCRKICGPILGIYKSLRDTWMWESGHIHIVRLCAYSPNIILVHACTCKLKSCHIGTNQRRLVQLTEGRKGRNLCRNGSCTGHAVAAALSGAAKLWVTSNSSCWNAAFVFHRPSPIISRIAGEPAKYLL